MSGGAYDYLCYEQTLENLITKQRALEEMSDRLAGIGYAQDAARETQELLVLMRQGDVRLQVRVARLKDVWQAVEWWDSGDCTEVAVREALAAYRGDGEQR